MTHSGKKSPQPVDFFSKETKTDHYELSVGLMMVLLK